MKASTTLERVPPLTVEIGEALEEEFDAVAMLRACSFYVVPPERSFAGKHACSAYVSL